MTALKLLETWSGSNFGVRIRDTVRVVDEGAVGQEPPRDGLDRLNAGIARAEAWWAENGGRFSAQQQSLPEAAATGRRPLPAGDFELPVLDGRRVRLSEFRGRVVLLHFWTTWCTACMAEISTLVALQRKSATELVVLGVSLDYVADSHGHIGHHPAVEEQAVTHPEHAEAHDADDHDHRAGVAAIRNRVREKLLRTVQARGIDYRVLVDERNEVGGGFHGGELPINVIIDPEGNVRRRFVGARSLETFEAMIREAAKSP